MTPLRAAPAAAFAVLFPCLSFSAFAALPAFPGAEGYGAYATGGRGGDVYHVTNLNSSGAGSFADAIATVPTAGRTIVFDVSGYIRFPSGSNGVRMTASKVTIAGQTAPGDGVGFTNNFFRISGDDIVVRHLRFRMGKNGSGGDCVDLDSGTLNAILDHVSMEFSTDENMSSFGSPPENLTLQYSLNAWGLESHSCGGLWDQNHATSHHNLWAHNHTRNPKSRPGGLLEWINNVTFDWDIGFIMGDSESVASWKANVLNNYFICPPGNTQSRALVKGTVATNGLPNFTVFLSGNLIDNNGDGILNGTDKGYSIVEGSVYSAAETPAAAPGAYRYYQSASAIAGSTAGVATDAPLLAYKKVVSNAGALRLDSNYTGALRDEVDTILLSKLTTQTAFHITRESSTGASASGFGVLASTSAPLDTDRDGMPDYWESALGFNVAVDDHNTVFASSGGLITGTTFFPAGTPAGYTRLEEYLHFLAIPHGIVARNTAATPSSISIDLRKFTAGFINAPVFTLANLVGGAATQSGTGGYLVTFTPTVNTQGRARFEFTVTDADGSTWTQTYALLVSAAALPRDIVWKGDGTTNTWDETAANWLRNGTATTYGAGDRVTFDDIGSRSPAVALSGALTPGSVEVKTAFGYTFGGAGTIASPGPLTKSGAGTLTLGTNNTYAGGILLQEGAITLNGSGSLSGGTLSMQDGTSITNALAAGTTASIGNPIEVPAGQAATFYSGNRLVWSGALTGGGTLNLTVQTTLTRFDIKGATAAFAGNVIFSGSGGVRLFTNGGSFNGFDAAMVDLGGSVGLYPQTNSGGNSYAIGALTGASSSAILGGGSAGAPTYTIGGLNQSSTFAGSIQGNAVLIKAGTGAFTLGGANTYTGATTVSAGSLIVAGSLGNSPVTVASGAVLAGSGTLGGSVTASAGGILSPGTAPFTGATMTVGNGLSLNGNTLYFDLSNAPTGANDKIVLSGGALTMSGTQYFQFLLLQGTLAAGTYDLVTGAASISASGFTLTHNLPVGGRQTFTLAPIGTTLRLTVTGNPATLIWTGATSANWDTTTASNFSGATPNTFGSNDAVVFDDSSAVTSILIPSPVTPRSTLVNNTTKAFTIAGGINAGSLTKSGTNTLTLTGTNTYPGGTFLNAGTIILANDNANSNALGTGPVTFANGTMLTMYNNVSGDNTAAWGMVVPAGVSAALNADSRVTLSGSLTGGGTLNMWIPYVRTSITGDWSAFTGTINVSTDGDGGDFRFGTSYAYAGFPSAAIFLPNKVTMYDIGILAAGAGTTIPIGELSGAANATLLGGPTGGRALTYRIGGRNTDATFAGTIGEQGGISGGNITSYVKTGTGTWTLSGTCAYNGGTTVEQGTLRILGSVTSNGGQCDVAASATLKLEGGTLTVDSTNIAANAQLIGNGTINGDLNNSGSTSSSTGGTLAITGSVVNTGSMVITNGSTLRIDGDMVNNGTLYLTAGGQLTGAGAIENDGIIDMMTGLQALPANFVNNGIVLDSSKVATATCGLSGTAFTVSVKGYTGHYYQLQKTSSLAANSWQNVGAAQPGTGALTGAGTQLDLVDAGATGSKNFYRVVVTP